MQVGDCRELRFDPALVVVIHKIDGEFVYGRFYDTTKGIMSFDALQFLKSELGATDPFPMVPQTGIEILNNAKEWFASRSEWEAAASVRDVADKIKKLPVKGVK